MSNYKHYSNNNSSYYYSNKSSKNSYSSNHSNSINQLSNSQQHSFSNDSMRIIKRNLVYVINLDPSIADKDILMRKEYFGQYGKIQKIVVNSSKAYLSNNSSVGPSYSAYVYYNTNQEAALAILSVDSSIVNNKTLKAAFGTTKYCSYYLKKTNCNMKDCVYIHSPVDKSDIISKDSVDFYNDQHLLAIKISEIETPSMKEILYKSRGYLGAFPNSYTLYSKKSIQYLIDMLHEERSVSHKSYEAIIDEDSRKGNKKYTVVETEVSSDVNSNGEKSKIEETLKPINLPIDNSPVDHLFKDKDEVESNAKSETANILGKIENQSEVILEEPQTKHKSNEISQNKRFALYFNKTSRFINDNSNQSQGDSQEQELSLRTKEEKIIRSYYSRYSFSQCFKSSNKEIIEERYYKLINNE